MVLEVSSNTFYVGHLRRLDDSLVDWEVYESCQAAAVRTLLFYDLFYDLSFRLAVEAVVELLLEVSDFAVQTSDVSVLSVELSLESVDARVESIDFSLAVTSLHVSEVVLAVAILEVVSYTSHEFSLSIVDVETGTFILVRDTTAVLLAMISLLVEVVNDSRLQRDCPSL